MLEFAFMRKALIAGLMLAIMIPMIGIIMVNRKTSMIGDIRLCNSLCCSGIFNRINQKKIPTIRRYGNGCYNEYRTWDSSDFI